MSSAGDVLLPRTRRGLASGVLAHLPVYLHDAVKFADQKKSGNFLCLTDLIRGEQTRLPPPPRLHHRGVPI